MATTSSVKNQPSLKARRKTFEYRLWVFREMLQAAREVLLVVLFAAVVLYVVVAIAEGQPTRLHELLGEPGYWPR